MDQQFTDQRVTDQRVTDQRVTDQRVTDQRVTDQQWLHDYRRRVDEIGARAAHTQAQLRAVEATASSRDGSVTVTVDSVGALRRLVFDERTDGLSRIQLAATVLDTARQAQQQARRQTDELGAAYLREISAQVPR